MKRLLPLLAVTLFSCTQAGRAGEIGYIEAFSLAAEREEALKQLIPGTEEFYYFHCLYFQQTEQWAKVDQMLAAWIERYQHTARVIEIQNRQALLTYDQNHQRALDLIRQRLNLQFNHQRELLNQNPNLPTALDPALIARERLAGIGFNNYRNSVEGFEDAALDWLLTLELNPDQRRHLLSRLTRPDHPKLVQLIIDDLNHANSGGFGSMTIHRNLLLSQLNECLELKPDLRDQGEFVNTYLTRLQPTADENWRQDRDALAAYLDRLWAFVETLAPVHNSLKAHVLYHRLVLDRSRGTYDAERFMTYLKLPRIMPYMREQYLLAPERVNVRASLDADYSAWTLLPPVFNDEPLVRSYLAHFFLEAENFAPYAPYVNDGYLKQVFAETKIVNGLGDAERWYSMLPPATYQALKERIDLDFAFENQTEFAPDQPVGLDVYVKNVPTLIVKVFEINTGNFYRANLRPIDTDVNLDGLVPNHEETHSYDDPPLRRVRRHFNFPQLDHRGVYVIDFIGNGISSRALVRKGQLRHLVRTGVAGQVFTILDENQLPVPQATLWLAGTLYTPDEKGVIVTPFSNQPGRQPIVLSVDGFSSLDHFQQAAESYSLAAGIYVDREELLNRRTARLLVRPSLTVAGTPIALTALEEVKLLITSTDLDGVPSSQEVPDFKLFDDRETVHEFQVPKRLATISFQLRAKVQVHSQNQKVDLATDRTFSINEIDRTDRIEDLHFLRVGSDYVVDVYGKTGEFQPSRPVQLSLKARDFRDPVHVVLQTDERGRVTLGPLPGILAVTATGPQGTSHTWLLRDDLHTQQQVVQGPADQPLTLAYMGEANEPKREELSLLELRGETYAADRFEALSIDNGLLRVSDLPPGDYSLLFRDRGIQVRLRLTAGADRNGWVLGSFRQLQVTNPNPLQLDRVEVDDAAVRVRLRNVTPHARVHVFATRFQPAFSAYGNLSSVPGVEPSFRTAPRIESAYMAGRDIGDEYRYIIDRRFARKFPGNMLDRPSLLLNPWAIRSTQTHEQQVMEGEEFGAGGAPMEGMDGRAEGDHGVVQGQADFANLDFLAESSLVLVNLLPNDEGVIELLREDLGQHQELLFVAVDPLNTASRIVTLPDVKVDHLDLRLAKGLDPANHYTQQQRISILAAGEKLSLADIGSSRFEAYDNLARVYALYATLNRDPNLVEFGFLLNWPTLEAAEKRRLYSKYACHELHFFLLKKDPDFFAAVVRPYLENKKDKTYLDRWLLDGDLTEFQKPWTYRQMNTFERVLLGQRIAAERPEAVRFVHDQFELLPPQTERFSQLFLTAIKGSALDTSDALGIREALMEVDQPVTLSFGVMNGNFDADENGIAQGRAAGGIAGAIPPPAPMAAEPESAAAPAAEGKGREEFAKKMADRSSSERQRSMLRRGSVRGRDKADEKSESLFADEAEYLGRVVQYYQKLDKTMEWVENNYYHLPIDQQNENLIAVNSFWNDYAGHDPAQPFYSTNLADSSRNLPDMLLALALLDLPFTPAKHETQFDGAQMTLTAGGPMIVYHEEILPAAVGEEARLLLSQNFFRHGDRHLIVDGQQLDKFVTEEFLIDVVYGCQVVVTNPTSTPRSIDVLLQVPVGSLPVMNGQNTRSVHLDLQPYHTQTVEYYFYFPAPGKFAHYPVQAASQAEVLAFAEPFTFNVVAEATLIDKSSWDFVSQHGTDDDVLSFLKRTNLLRINLDRIAFRMRDQAFFNRTIDLLTARHVYNHTLWSYGVLHDEPPAIRQFLEHADGFVAQTGLDLRSPLLDIDPVLRKTYEHMDYRPLVNARVGQLGRNRQILNDRFLAQYQRLLNVLAYRRGLSDDDRMAVIYYLLLQDRVEESLAMFDQVNPDKLETRLQYDYFTAYLDMYKSQPDSAREIARRHAEHPVDRWKNAFVNVVNQVDELDDPNVKVADAEDRTQRQTGLAATSPSFDFAVEAKQVRISYQNLADVQVNYYLMDIELLFSRNPFVQQTAGQFAYILPNVSQTVKLPGTKAEFVFPLPDELRTRNVLVEVTGAGQTRSQPYFANALTVQMLENFGQVRVTHGAENAPLSTAYVKVYARMQDGSVQFYKDGYTDLRGRFDYTSLSTDELDRVERFSLLVLSDELGAVVREAAPPKR
jgi:hypothetical protein